MRTESSPVPNILRQARIPNILQGATNVEITKKIYECDRLAGIYKQIGSLAVFPPSFAAFTMVFGVTNSETAFSILTASTAVFLIAEYFKFRNLDKANEARVSLSPPR